MVSSMQGRPPGGFFIYRFRSLAVSSVRSSPSETLTRVAAVKNQASLYCPFLSKNN